MKAPTALIADDEAPLRDFLRKRLADVWPELQIVAEARNGPEAQALIESLRPDVAFLDIRMPGASGLDVARNVGRLCRVVFVTAFDAFAVEAFEQAAVDYLVKPVSSDRLGLTVERLRQSLREAMPPPDLAELLARLLREQQGGAASAALSAAVSLATPPTLASAAAPPGQTVQPLRWIRASRGDTTHHVPVSEIRYVQSDDKYTVIRTQDGEHLIRTPLTELVAQLDPDVFWQIHRSTVVNMDWVQSTRRDGTGRMFVCLRPDQVELPVSRAFAGRFRQM